MIMLAEGGFLPFHCLFDHRGPEDFLILPDQGNNRIDQELECILFPLGKILSDLRRNSNGSFKVLIVDKLITIVDEQVGTRILHSQADDVLSVLLELGDQWGEIAVTRNDDEGVDMLLGVAKVYCIHG